jgi:acyl carrier protein
MTTMQDVLTEIRRILADLTGSDMPLAAPPHTQLLRDGIGLDSLGATILLARIQTQFGIDVASEDLNLDALASIGALAEFIGDRIE